MMFTSSEVMQQHAQKSAENYQEGRKPCFVSMTMRFGVWPLFQVTGTAYVTAGAGGDHRALISQCVLVQLHS